MNNSLWIESCKDSIREYDKLNENINTEICIIGGGLTGLSTAYYLSKQGKDVILIEKNKIGSHTSGNTTGKITSQHGLFYQYLISSVGKEKAQEYLYSNEEAIRNIEKIVREEKIDCDFENQDAYIFTKDVNELEKIKEEVNAVKSLGFSAEFLNGNEIPFKISKNNSENNKKQIDINKNILGAIKYPDQAQFNPVKYMLGLANKIEEYKGKIYENTKATDVNKVEDGYIITTEDGYKIKSKYVVIASHYPFINAPGFYFMKMYQVTSYLIAVKTKEELFDGMYINSENPTISLRTAIYNNERVLLIGGMNHKTGAKINLKDSYKMLEDIAKKLYPKCEILFRWNTEDCVSLDKIPYIGVFSSLMPNVYVATGYKKWGMTTSNVAANIITNKILGKSNKYEKVFDSTRLKPLKNHEELGNMIKEVSYSLVINKLKKPDEVISNIKNGEGKIVEIDNKKVGVYKNENGEIFAIKPVCSHLGCELTWNDLDKTWDCPCHGSRFDYKGKSIYDPSIKNLERLK